MTAAGAASCRLCDAPNGCAEITDGRQLVWPEGLAHYVEAHGVRLPAKVVELMRTPPSPIDASAFTRDLFRVGRVTLDYEWWRCFGTVRGGNARLLMRGRVDAPRRRA